MRKAVFTEVIWADKSFIRLLFGALLPQPPRSWPGRFLAAIRISGGSSGTSSSSFSSGSHTSTTSSTSSFSFGMNLWTYYWIIWYSLTVYLPFVSWRLPVLLAAFGKLQPSRRYRFLFGKPHRGLSIILPLMFSDLLSPLGSRIRDQWQGFLSTWGLLVVFLSIFALALYASINGPRRNILANRKGLRHLEATVQLCTSMFLISAAHAFLNGPVILFSISQVCFSVWSILILVDQMSDYRKMLDASGRAIALAPLFILLVDIVAPNPISRRVLDF